MAFETTRQQLLQQAALLDRKYGKSGNQEFRDEAIRLRRIVAELEAFTSGGGATDLNGLSDVTISAPTNAQVLTYNSTTSQWENQTPGGGGGGGDMYKSTYDVDNDGIVDGSETTQIIVRNSTGSTLTKGQVVYLSGATGNRPNAVLSQAHTEATSSKTIGIVVADISNNSDGYVAVNGTLHDLDTSAFADGAAVWLSATTAGAYTSTIPAEPNHTVFIGYIARSHPTQGRLVILIQNGYELNELHGVLISSEANNDLLVYESSTSLWKNKTISTIFGGTPLVSVPTLAQVTTAGNTTTNSITVGGLVVDTNTLVVDSVNDRVGIGTVTPSDKLHIQNGNLLIARNDAVTSFIVQTNLMSGDGSALFVVQSQLGDARMRFLAYGNTAVSPSLYGIYIQAGNYNSTGNSPLYFSGYYGNTGSDLTFDFSKVMFVNGNVLIGTTINTGHKLRVNGTVSAALTNATHANAVYYNTATGELTYGAAGGGTTPTLAQVTTAGNTTTNAITVGGLVVDTNTLVVDSVNNRVGIGTTTPSTLLEVVGNYAGVTDSLIPQLKFQNSNTTSSAHLLAIARVLVGTGYLGGFPEIWIQAYRDASNNGNTSIRTTSNHPLNFWTNDIERLRIFANGNVAIGTTTDAGYKLDVNGTARVSGDFTVASSIIQKYTSGGITNDATKIVTNNLGASFGVQNSNASGFSGVEYLDQNGNVKVFTGFNNNNAKEFRFNNMSTNGFIQFIVPTDASSYVDFGSGYSGGVVTNSLFRFRSNGNVTIGTTTDAGYKLDVNGTFRSNGDTLVTTANGRVAGFTGLASGQTVHLQYGGDSNHRISTLYGSGVTFDTYHGVTIRTSTASSGKALIINQRNSAHYIQEWQDNGTTRAFIDSGGNLFLYPLNSSGDGFVTATGGILNTISYGYTGIITFPSNFPGQQNLDFQNGILVNVF